MANKERYPGLILHKISVGATLNPKRCGIYSAAWTIYIFLKYYTKKTYCNPENFVQNSRSETAQNLGWCNVVAIRHPKRCGIYSAAWATYIFKISYDSIILAISTTQILHQYFCAGF